jgi:hypothetical protein
LDFPVFLVFLCDHRRFLDTITFARDGDYLGVMQEPVNYGPAVGTSHKSFPYSFSGRLLVMMVERFS